MYAGSSSISLDLMRKAVIYPGFSCESFRGHARGSAGDAVIKVPETTKTPSMDDKDGLHGNARRTSGEAPRYRVPDIGTSPV